MIEIQRHIEILLLSNECVIVPDFGGFMTHAVPARYDEEDHLFLPPLRTLGFNPQLRMNDSLLAQSYAEAYDISYPEALRRISQEVAELKQLLSEQGHYTMDDLGTLTVNQEGNYEFSPCEAGILSPDLYGLNCFPFDRLKGAKAAELPLATAEKEEQPMTAEKKETPERPTVAVQPTAEAEEEQPSLLEFVDTDDDRAISIKMSWVRNAVAVAAAVVAFFLVATPVGNSDLSYQSMSNLQGHILYKLMPEVSNDVPMAEPVAEKSAVEPVAEKSAADAASADKPTVAADVKPETSYTYYIIVASQVKRSNAESYVETLHLNGHNEAKVLTHNNVVRVTCGEFDSEDAAYRQLQQLHKQDGFEEAWVYKLKL